MVEIAHPILFLFVWIGAQLVCGYMGYRHGRDKTELAWRRYYHPAPPQIEEVPGEKTVGFRKDDNEPDTLRSGR